MSKRIFFVAIMTVLLIGGLWSSAACEVSCAPTAQNTAQAIVVGAACCPQQMASHCDKTGTQVAVHAADCRHSADGSAVAISSATHDFQINLAYETAAGVVQSNLFFGLQKSISAAVFRRTANIPLRI